MRIAPTVSTSGWSHQKDGALEIHRTLPEETPVAIVFNGSTQAVMMATPCDIEDFAYGFSLTEGAITDIGQIENIEVVPHNQGIEVQMWLAEDRAEMLAARRRSMAGPVGCGLCGIDSIEQAMRALPQLNQDDFRITSAEVACATDDLRSHQSLHDQTHATHAAGFLVPAQGIVLAREDVGRHNALDKLLGALLRSGIDPTSGAVVMTSRLSVDLVQKCALAGVPTLIAVSAPTAQAVRVAQNVRITLAAFARQGGFDIYSHPNRIVEDTPDGT
ncbi:MULTISPECIES: formate dehydrogenase accessory sulfurtransferase FdhD [Pacificibacter]|uniref:formate dehydrogenase accessory sulfurtransferase FdhD n=1 Tax=Pacificibacter TaxID=1042323 RepID=UPI001C08CA3F|nr:MULTISPECIES: formate dehydrogenase accessory sulfurtransferase FdhD [Pacificibacter]MBU2937756.1 formate dehydrogenase accessory sulfurtransferase FdhD [Pacificibacter marinus]MDO6616017.1 formate dehydrogenase accessory sulfurtransferase FdhD [Pacificibacter sp. 1_MG-2023]